MSTTEPELPEGSKVGTGVDSAPDTAAASSGRHGLAENLENWALEEGFTRAALARLQKSQHGGYLRRWLNRGGQAGMKWIERRIELRDDPERLLPGARSVLCVALQYYPLADQPEDPEGDLWPRVARYARGRDYHDIMGKSLKRLAARIREAYPGSQTRPYVDTGPVLERELAARAGIGVFGKNTNLLHREWGSYFLLGEILLTLQLEPDDPGPERLSDLCGRCTLCLESCPTHAFPEPYQLDAQRCISYWTIEHRGALPEEAREMVGDWVFGCDVCQEVCPWNRRGPRAGEEARLGLPEERRELDLAGLLSLNREQYVERFIRSPMKRAKLEGLKRNAAVAMGNRGDQRYVEPLASALKDESPLVRRHAAWALGKIGGSEASRALQAAANRESDPEVQQELAAATQRTRVAEHPESTDR